MDDILNQIVSVNNFITKALNSGISVGDQELNDLLNMAYALKEEASLTPSTEYDLLVDNIEKLEGKLGISKQTSIILTSHDDRELRRKTALSRDGGAEKSHE